MPATSRSSFSRCESGARANWLICEGWSGCGVGGGVGGGVCGGVCVEWVGERSTFPCLTM